MERHFAHQSDQDLSTGHHRRISRCVRHLEERHEERGPLDQGTDRRGIASAFDQVVLPVARNDVLVDLRRSSPGMAAFCLSSCGSCWQQRKALFLIIGLDR